MSRKRSAVARKLLYTGLLLATCVAAAQQMPWQKGTQPDADPVVYLYPEQVELVRGKPSEVDLHFRIREGLHINSHEPTDKDLSRTDLLVVEPPGLNVQKVTFPLGTPYSSRAFPDQKLSVYSGELVLHARLLADRPGEQVLRARLRYQACDADSCFPPKESPVALSVVVH